MQRSKNGKIIALFAIIIIVLATIIFNFLSPKEEMLIKEFVHTWFSDSQANHDILSFLESNGQYVKFKRIVACTR